MEGAEGMWGRTQGKAEGGNAGAASRRRLARGKEMSLARVEERLEISLTDSEATECKEAWCAESGDGPGVTEKEEEDAAATDGDAEQEGNN